MIDYRNWQLSLGRRFRSIKLWFVLRSYGVEGLQKHLRSGVDLCGELAKHIEQTPNFEIVTPPSLGLLSFRLVNEGERASDEELNKLNADLNNRLAHHPEVMLTQTLLKTPESEIFCIRFAIGGRTTTLDDVKHVFSVVEAEGKAALSAWKA